MDAKKGIAYFAALSVALVAQTSIFPVFFSGFSIPQITLMLVLVWTVREGFIRMLPWIIAAGFFLDLVSYAPVGTAIAFFVLAAYAASFFSRRFLVERENWGALAALFFIIIITVSRRLFLLLTFFIAGEFPKTAAGSLVFFRHLGSEAILNCLLFFLLLLIFKKKNEKLFSLKKTQ